LKLLKNVPWELKNLKEKKMNKISKGNMRALLMNTNEGQVGK
jgi:hypothetical protein